MYVRKVRAGKKIFFQIGNKVNKKFVLVKHIGSASSPEQVELLHQKALAECERLKLEVRPTLFPLTPEREKAKLVNWRITGFHQVFGSVYNRIGFPSNHLRDLAIARIAYPRSKLATARYLEQYLGISLSEDRIYRFLDTLDKDELTKIAFNFVKKKNGNSMALVFYDVTTLYFETNGEDDLRKKGYSKDHKNDLPQIVIGLFVDKDGYPFDFDFYDGKTFEGHTFSVAVENLIKKYQLPNLVVVADAGMLSEQNISFLETQKLTYIVGARLKGMSEKFKQQIFNHNFTKNNLQEVLVSGNAAYQVDSTTKRLIIDYSEKRARKNKFHREKLVKALEAKITSKKPLTKRSKYLLVQGKDQVLGIDQTKIDLDQRHDGLKGYWTNLKAETKPTEIIDQYHNLWKVEKAFRMSKSDLLERPIFHRKEKRIAGHLLICFSSLLVMKETERLLKEINISLARSIELLGKIGQGEMRLGKITMPIESDLTPETNQILNHILGH
ncbi:MAG: IS1634 family transposase [Patescibacteria group bacterium]